MTPRKKPSAGFWITVALVVVLVGYPLSQGPAGWIVVQIGQPSWAVKTFLVFYWPVMLLEAWLDTNAPKWIGECISGYLALWH